jgi:hypothetical protein
MSLSWAVGIEKTRRRRGMAMASRVTLGTNVWEGGLERSHRGQGPYREE